MDYIRTCVTGVCEHAEELDALIAQYAVRWNLHRISRLTKAAMRFAIYEMRYVDDVPNGVAINECVELTRKYEDAQVVSFVNGILGSVARGAKPNTEAPADPQPEEAQPEGSTAGGDSSEETQPAPEDGAAAMRVLRLRHQQLYDLGRVVRRHGRSQYLASARCGAGRTPDCARVMRCSPIKRLPELADRLFSDIGTDAGFEAVGVSTRPRAVEGSYMPCFLAGESQARVLGAALGVPVLPFSHQQGHIAACCGAPAIWS